MHTLFIHNPVAGAGRSRAALQKARAVFDQHQEPYEVRESLAPGHATELAKSAARQGFGRVVSVGGDGTVCEVAQGLIHTSTVMGIIPGGTGNDYRRCLNIPKDPAAAAKAMLFGRVRKVDCMQVDEFVGLNISTVGFDSEVVRNAERFAKFRGLSYLLSTLYTVPRYTRPELRVTVDETVFEGPRFLVAAGCGTHYGGGMRVLPDSDPTDGLLDVCIIDSVRLPKDYVSLLPQVIRGTYKKANRSEVHTLRAKTLVIESESGMTLNLDGTLFDSRRRVEMAVIPAALNIAAP